uniref:Beta-flanking protein n=1 Tax=Coprinellus disseminatus TaxID=71703 RepID=Q1WMS1_COPDI|nr:beta-flanking protein [Coprinellus disseminatus]
MVQISQNLSEANVNKTGGAELNSPHHSGQHSSGGPSFDQDEVVKTASHHGSGESSLFSTALSFISKNKDKEEEPIDEEDSTKAHEKVYQKNDASGLSASALGSAAALQVLQQFVGGKASSSSSSQSGGTTQLISLAMAEATKLFDKSGDKVIGDKQDAVNGAAMTIMKLVVQSKFGGSGTTGGKDSGGLSGLLSLASQFAK